MRHCVSVRPMKTEKIATLRAVSTRKMACVIMPKTINETVT